MEKRTRSRLICTPHLEDVPELIHRIQSLLPVEEATRTCILNKSWRHAWSTIPTLRFPYQPEKFETEEQERKHKMLIDRTLQRYHRDNIPIESLHLQCHIHNQDSAFVAENWIQSVASISCLKELFLKISVLTASFTLTNELFSSENLNTINVTANVVMDYPLRICKNPVIKCVSLRVLDLHNVFISDKLLDKLLSTCSLLEKIELSCYQGLKNCKVKNLPHHRKLIIFSIEKNDHWEINNVPSLFSFNYYGVFGNGSSTKPIPFKLDSLGRLTQLELAGVIIDYTFLDIIESKFPLLENLRLKTGHWKLKSLVIKSVTLKWLTLDLWEYRRRVNVQVCAPKLLSFIFQNTSELHSLVFPNIAPEQIKLIYEMRRPLDHSFFLKMREVLNLSRKLNIDITDCNWDPPNIDVDDLRREISFPVKNVQEVLLLAYSDKHMWEKTRFFDALFLICHPHYIKCSKLVAREMMEKKMNELEDIQVQDPHNGKWESLTSSGKSVLDALPDPIKFKLNWFSQ